MKRYRTSTLIQFYTRSNNLDLRYDFFPDFYFDDLKIDECVSEFRFHKHDLPSLTEMKSVLTYQQMLIRLARQISVPTYEH